MYCGFAGEEGRGVVVSLRHHGALQFRDNKSTEVHGCFDELMLSCGGKYIYDDFKHSDVEKSVFHSSGLPASETNRVTNCGTTGRCYGEYIHDDSRR
jgi:hypothetical protein